MAVVGNYEEKTKKGLIVFYQTGVLGESFLWILSDNGLIFHLFWVNCCLSIVRDKYTRRDGDTTPENGSPTFSSQSQYIMCSDTNISVITETPDPMFIW